MTQAKGSNLTLPGRFFENLEQAVMLSRDLLAILNEERKAMVAMDMQALAELSARKENRLHRLNALDSLIAEMTGNLQPEAGKRAGLSGLIPLLGKEEGSKLKQFQKRIAGLREEISRCDQINRFFASDVQNYINDAISLITSAIADRPLYGRLAGLARKPSLNQPSLISREV